MKTNSSSVTSIVVGEEIRRVRKTAGLTQAELAARMGAAAPYVTAIERGRENLTLGSLARIAAALGTGLEVSFPAMPNDYERLDQDLAELRAAEAAAT